MLRLVVALQYLLLLPLLSVPAPLQQQQQQQKRTMMMTCWMCCLANALASLGQLLQQR